MKKISLVMLALALVAAPAHVGVEAHWTEP